MGNCLPFLFKDKFDNSNITVSFNIHNKPNEQLSQRRFSYCQVNPVCPNEVICQESVSKFLLSNPIFLDNFVKISISPSKLQQWAKLKIQNELEIGASLQRGEKSRSKTDIQLGHVNTIAKELYFPRYPSLSAINRLQTSDEINPPMDIENHLFPNTEIPSVNINSVFMYMVEKLFGKNTFPEKEFARFLARVQANYFSVPFHNYNHALGHAQTMYWILKNNPLEELTELEKKTLMIAALTHDLGHPGFGDFLSHETYQWTFKFPYMERHHSQLLFLILLDDEYNIFSSLSNTDLSKVVFDLKRCILSPHLANYTDVLNRFKDASKDTCEIGKDLFKYLLMDVLMTVCDLSACWKSWNVHKESVINFYKELSDQAEKVNVLGTDQEYGATSGKTTTSVPVYSVDFLTRYIIPLLEEIINYFPCFEPALQRTKENLEQWLSTDSNE